MVCWIYVLDKLEAFVKDEARKMGFIIGDGEARSLGIDVYEEAVEKEEHSKEGAEENFRRHEEEMREALKRRLEARKRRRPKEVRREPELVAYV